jgi:peroxiredoxin Q/BCP
VNVAQARPGRLLVRWWFPAARTPGCTRQAEALRASWSALDRDGVDVVGLSLDAPSTLAAWRAELRLPFTLRAATIGEAARLGALREPDDPWRTHQAARVATIVDDSGAVLAHWAVRDPDRFAVERDDAHALVRADTTSTRQEA